MDGVVDESGPLTTLGLGCTSKKLPFSIPFGLWLSAAKVQVPGRGSAGPAGFGKPSACRNGKAKTLRPSLASASPNPHSSVVSVGSRVRSRVWHNTGCHKD